MAIRQKLKGEQTKTYDVLLNFNKGINKKAADDLADDSSFRELSNFYNKQDGVLSKRPGLYDTHFLNFMVNLFKDCTILYNEYTDPDSHPKYYRFKEFLYHMALNGDFSFKNANLIGLQIIKNENFNKVLENYVDVPIKHGGSPNIPNEEENTNRLGENGIPNTFDFNANFMFSYNLKLNITYTNPSTGSVMVLSEYETDRAINLTKVHIFTPEGTTNTIKIEIEQIDTSYNNYENAPNEDEHFRWLFKLDPNKPISYASYNGYTYITTGYNYLIKIMDDFPTSITYTPGYSPSDNPDRIETTIIEQIGGYLDNVYKPVPVEASNIGFNLLAKNPLTAINNTGSTDNIKGVFYSVTKNSVSEPISNIPSNAPFTINLMQTGSTATSQPEYRLNNGDTDTATNPYKTVPGSMGTDVYNCSGINETIGTELEFKFTKGNSTFISYVTVGTDYNRETGLVQDVSKLIYSSSHIKVINNQLVLYGGHGYIFFSDYDNFKYFPNYFYLYVTTDAGEEEVTAIKYFRQYYAVFTNKRIKRMSGNFGSDNFGVYPLNDFIGCSNEQTIQQVNNNLLFVGIDGIYKLKQGYMGEGTENVERIDDVLCNEINSSNVDQCFVLSNYYIMKRKDKNELILYDFEKDAFLRFNLESATPPAEFNQNLDPANIDDGSEFAFTSFDDFYKKNKIYNCFFQNNLFDENGASLLVMEYESIYAPVKLPGTDPTYWILQWFSPAYKSVTLRQLRMSDLEFLAEEERHQDSIGFISELETPKLNMGSPTNTKKFKEIYIKTTNESGELIPLYVTIWIDDVAYISPEDYEVKYDEETNTYYYVYTSESNTSIIEGAEIIKGQPVIGELTLGEERLGKQTVAQLKIKINKKGRSIKLKIADGYDDINDLINYTSVVPNNFQQDNNILLTYNRYRNIHDFAITAIGIVYKLKKVKEG